MTATQPRGLPLDAKNHKRPAGEVHIIRERCKGCCFCIEFCPKKVLEQSPEFNYHGYHPPHVVKPDACTGCSMCEMICPEFAIFTTAARGRPAESRDEHSAPGGEGHTGS